MIGPSRRLRWAGWGALGALVLLVVVFVGYHRAERQLDAVHAAQLDSLRLVDELRQSSDDLTRMVRTYVVTGEESYRERFEQIMAVRDGRATRPAQPTSGWEREPDAHPDRAPPQEAVALLDLMRAAGFTPEELALLEQAKRGSDELARTELEAMALVADAPVAEVDRQRAVELLYGEEYLDAKAAIMAPIAQVERSVADRFAASLDRVTSTVRVWFALLAGVGALLVGVLWELSRQLRGFHRTQQQELQARDRRLAAREALLDALVDRSGLVAAVVDEHHHLVEADGQARAWLRAVEPPGSGDDADRPPARIGHPAAVAAVSEARGGQPSSFELSRTDGEGRERTVAFHAVRLDEAERELILVVGLEITARVEAERALKAANDVLEAAIGQSPSGIVIADAPEVTIRVANDEALRIRGGSAQRLIGIDRSQHVSRWGLLRSDGTPIPAEELPLSRAVLAGQTVHDEQLRIRRDDGSERWISASAAPVRDDEGRILCAVSVFHDVTERHLASLALADDVRVLEQILDATLGGYWDRDIPGHTEYLSPGFKAMFGYADHELANRPETWQQLILPEDLPVVLAAFDRHVESRGRAPFAVEVRYRHRDGSTVWVLCVGRVIEWSGEGAPIRAVGCHLDISARKQVENELIEAKVGAEAASVAKSRFLATMSHEIRTPLNGILGVAQLLLAGPVDAERLQKYARTILASGKSLLALLNDVLDLSRIEAGGLRLEQGEVMPAGLIREVGELYRGRAVQKGLELTVGWHGDQDERFEGDGHRLRQMLSNLVHNAVKFTEQGEVGISARVVEESGDAAVVEFAVRDTGIGVAPEDHSGLFVPFQQVDASTTRRFEGTGLGLSIVSSLAQAMGGEVGVEGELGEGARFFFRVPMRRLRDEVVLEPGTAPAPSGCGRVLLVEDREDNRVILGAMLDLLGFEHEIAHDGEQAVARVRSEPFDAVLMDVHMPRVDGYEATGRIRAWERDQQRAPVPIVALTASAFQRDLQACLEAGMDDHLTKPVDLADLRVMLETHVVVRPAPAT